MLLRKREMEGSGSRRKSGENTRRQEQGTLLGIWLRKMELKIPPRRGQLAGSAQKCLKHGRDASRAGQVSWWSGLSLLSVVW